MTLDMIIKWYLKRVIVWCKITISLIVTPNLVELLKVIPVNTVKKVS